MAVVLMEAHGVLETLPLQLLEHLEGALQARLGPRASSSSASAGACIPSACLPTAAGLLHWCASQMRQVLLCNRAK